MNKLNKKAIEGICGDWNESIAVNMEDEECLQDFLTLVKKFVVLNMKKYYVGFHFCKDLT